MYKRLVFAASMLLFASTNAPVFAGETIEVMVCTKAKHATDGAEAMRALYLLDGTAISITIALKKKKFCWFELVTIPKKYTPLTRLYLEDGYSNAYVVIPIRIKGVMRYAVFFEEGVPVVNI